MKQKVFLTALILMAFTAWASAQNSNTSTRPSNGTCRGSAYVDNNKNGTCDNYENRTATGTVSGKTALHRGDGTGKTQGNRKGRGHRYSTGRNYVDANNNGVCDRYESGTSNNRKE